MFDKSQLFDKGSLAAVCWYCNKYGRFYIQDLFSNCNENKSVGAGVTAKYIKSKLSFLLFMALKHQLFVHEVSDTK